jgi:transposase
MFAVELYAKIRRSVMVDGMSRREAAKQFGVHRNTITKMLQFSIPPGYRRRERPASKKLGPYMAWIDAILEGDRSVHKKQRRIGFSSDCGTNGNFPAGIQLCVSTWRRQRCAPVRCSCH